MMLLGLVGALLAAGAAVSPEFCPYGVCAHVTRSERDDMRLGNTIRAMEFAGIRYVRSDFDSHRMVGKDGKWNFYDYDALLDRLEANQIQMLPIVYATENPPSDFEKYSEYIGNIVRHYGKRLPVIEVWNEANLTMFLKGADPLVYAKTLQTAYRTIKGIDPSIRVAYTGTAGVPLSWIRKTFEAGATNCFDIICVHPYNHPHHPEGWTDARLEELHALMAEFGIADRKVWITELGWPTHTPVVPYAHILLAGLKVARPEQKQWKVIVADLAVEGSMPDQTMAERIASLLPPGSEAVVCTQTETIRRLTEGGVDAVVYPFDESFPLDTAKAVNDFIARGGVLIDFGGVPCYYGSRDNKKVPGFSGERALKMFPFGFKAAWTALPGTYPKESILMATERGLAAGVKQEPTGFKAERFLTPERAGKEAEWIPLVAGRTTNGVELVGAAVIRYHGERKGAAVLCSLFGGGAFQACNEEEQARYTARSMAIAFAEGVEAFFVYNLRASENDPLYSEDHFGLMHYNFSPKPAYSAYMQFIRERPTGSTNTAVTWHDAKRQFYSPEWKRPDGKTAGMLWKLGKTERHTLRFADGKPNFRNLYGRKIGVRQTSGDAYELQIGESPIYYAGATLIRGNAE